MRDIRIQRAINTMKLALNAHRTMLLTDPPKDAWKYYNVEDQLRAAIDGLNEIGAAEVEGDPVAELVHAMFRSGNSIPVTRILITREQYEAACAHRTGQGQTRMDTGLSDEKEAGSGRGNAHGFVLVGIINSTRHLRHIDGQPWLAGLEWLSPNPPQVGVLVYAEPVGARQKETS